MQTEQSWTVPGSTTESVMNVLLANLDTQGWRDVTRHGGSARARFGSRLAFRFFGAYLRPGRERFPLRLVVSAAKSAPDAVIIDAIVSSDEGWYLGTLPVTRRLFEKHAADLFAKLQTSTPST